MKKAFGLWVTLPRAFPYLRPYRKQASLSILSTFVAAALALAEPWPLAIMVDSVLGDRKPPGLLQGILGEDPGTYKLLVIAVLAGFSLTLFTHGIGVLTDWVNAKTEQGMALDLRSDLFDHCQKLSLTFHDARLTGGLMQQINMQAAAIGAIVVAFPPILQAALTLMGMLVVAALIDWQVALVSLIAVPFIWYSLGLYGTKIVPRLQRVQALEWQSLSIVHEAMGMLRVIVSFGREKHEFRRFRSQGETAVDERVKLTVRQTLFSLGVTAATALGTSIVLGFGAWHVLQGKITVGELLVLIAYVAAIYQPLEEISNTIGELNEQFVQFNSSLDLLDVEKEVDDAPDAIDLGRSSGRVTFEDVHFAYKGRTDTLKGVSFATNPGQSVAIVGPTGAGKTTLTNLLIRFYDPQSGRILIDGVDIRKLKLKSLRDQISLVLQEPLLFSGTIAENIRYGRLDATMEEIVVAAKAANAHDFIEALPEGYGTELGERGAQLSGGERQRVSVARAFIRDAPILVLDEPTSSIDSKTESVILDVLDVLMEGRTSFMIAHRLSTVRDADLILVISEGRIVEQGTHDELVEIAGIYNQLHEAQTRQRRRRTRQGALTAATDGGAIGDRREGPGLQDGGGAFAETVTAAANGDLPEGSDADPRAVEALAAGDFDVHPATAPPPESEVSAETREEALAAGDFDVLGAGTGSSAPAVEEMTGATHPVSAPPPTTVPSAPQAPVVLGWRDALITGLTGARRHARARFSSGRLRRSPSDQANSPPQPFQAGLGRRARRYVSTRLSAQQPRPPAHPHLRPPSSDDGRVPESGHERSEG